MQGPLLTPGGLCQVWPEKVAYIKDKSLVSFDFEEIRPDANANWLNQSNSNFDTLLPLANRETKLAKRVEDERAVFGLYSLGVITAIGTNGFMTSTART